MTTRQISFLCNRETQAQRPDDTSSLLGPWLFPYTQSGGLWRCPPQQPDSFRLRLNSGQGSLAARSSVEANLGTIISLCLWWGPLAGRQGCLYARASTGKPASPVLTRGIRLRCRARQDEGQVCPLAPQTPYPRHEDEPAYS